MSDKLDWSLKFMRKIFIYRCILSNEAIPHLQNKSQIFNSAQFEKMCLPEYQNCILYMQAYCSNLVGLSMQKSCFEPRD